MTLRGGPYQVAELRLFLVEAYDLRNMSCSAVLLCILFLHNDLYARRVQDSS
jgi:hypothetical protein